MGSVLCINLSSKEMLARLYLATKGINGRVSNLLAEALELSDGKEELMLSHFSRAYIEANPTYELPHNPFNMPLREIHKYISGLIAT